MPQGNGTELATAYVTILPSTKGLGAALNAELASPVGAASQAAGKSLGSGLAGGVAKVGSALAAVGLVSFLKGSVDKAKQAEVAQTLLKRAVENTGVAWKQVGGDVDETIRKHSMLAAVDDEELGGALATLTQITGDVNEAQKLLGLTTDLARAKGLDLATAAKLVGRVQAGNTSILTRYGIVLEKGATAQEALAAMQKKFGGAAEDFGKTAEGASARAQVAFDNLQETVGSAVLPSVVSIADATTKVFVAFDKLPKPLKDATVMMGGAGIAALVAGPYIKTLGKAFNFAATAAKGLTAANVAAGISGIGTAATEAGVGVSLLTSGASIGEVISLGGGAAAAAISLTALAAAIGAAAGAAVGFALYKIPLVKKALEGLSRATEDSTGKFSDNKNAMLNFIGPLGFMIGGANKLGDMWGKAQSKGNGAAASAARVADKDNAIAGAASDATDATDDFVRALNGQKVAQDTLAGKARSLVDLDLAQKSAAIDAKKAYEDYQKLIEDGKRGTDESRAAYIAWQEAQLRASDATADLTTKQEELGVKVGTNKGKVRDYTAELGKVPNSVTTIIQTKWTLTGNALARTVLETMSNGRKKLSQILEHDSGGYFTRPHLGVVAEAGNPEYVINPRRANAPSLITAAAQDAGLTAAAPSVLFAPNIYADSMADRKAIRAELEDMWASMSRGFAPSY